MFFKLFFGYVLGSGTAGYPYPVLGDILGLKEYRWT